MAVRKRASDSFVVEGGRDYWLDRSSSALVAAGFRDVRISSMLGQVEAAYRKATTRGAIKVTLTPENGLTRITTEVVANVDNIFTLFRSPTARILDAFKATIR